MSDSKSKFRVDFRGILDILSKHLYSGEDVFIRELLQNSKDAITARQKEESVSGIVTVELIDNGDLSVLIFEDNGVGLNLQEVESFLSVIGSSSKKQIGELGQQPTDFVGQFGIGLLSCFMVSDKITLITKSGSADHMIKWEASIDGLYESKELDSGSMETGTKVFLELSHKKKSTYNSERIKYLLRKYSQFLDMEVSFVSGDSKEALPSSRFPWADAASTDLTQLEFGRRYFEMEFRHCIPLTSHDGKTQGIGYIYPVPSKPGSKSAHHVYIKNMLIDEEASGLFPEWAFFIRAVVNSEILKPTASRESIYKNHTLNETKEQFENCIRDYFSEIARTAPSELIRIIAIHQLAIKAFAAEDDDFFDLIIDYIPFDTSRGMMRVSDLLGEEEVKYVTDVETFKQVLPIAKANDQLIVNGGYIYDSTLLMRLEQRQRGHISKLDDLRFDSILVDLSWDEENALTEFKAKCNDVLNPFKCHVHLKKFSPESLPAIFHLDENQKQKRDLDRTKEVSSELWGGVLGDISTQHYTSYSQLYLNIDNALIKKISRMEQASTFQTIIELIYVNALMAGHYTLSSTEATILNHNLLSLIELIN